MQELEFRSWLRALDAEEPDAAAPGVAQPETHYATVTDEAEFQTWLERLRQAELFAFDTETTSLNYMQARIVGVSVAIEPFEAAYIPFGHDLAALDEDAAK